MTETMTPVAAQGATQNEQDHIQTYMHELGARARNAARLIANASSGQKDAALLAIADALEAQMATIIAENSKDMEAGRLNQLSPALLDRLELNEARIKAMSDGCRQIATLADPVGAISDMNYRPSGIQVGKMRVPLGVIGIIYESRPNVTVDAAALCLKAGNAVILRGGSEAILSNMAIANCIRVGMQSAGLHSDTVQVVETTDRALVGRLISSPEYVDVIIPRGGKSLVARINADATVPVIKHLDGICHVYIDDYADLQKAHEVAFNAKARRYGVCGAMETLLIARSIAHLVIPDLFARFVAQGVELRGCPETFPFFAGLKAATEEDWHTEYLDAILSVRIVDGLEQAMAHINYYGSHHTDAIVTESLFNARRFLREVDSSSVMVNASTQFADGFEYGLGAEIGISTDKLHVRGPVGLEGLTTQKYIVMGDGSVRA